MMRDSPIHIFAPLHHKPKPFIEFYRMVLRPQFGLLEVRPFGELRDASLNKTRAKTSASMRLCDTNPAYFADIADFVNARSANRHLMLIARNEMHALVIQIIDFIFGRDLLFFDKDGKTQRKALGVVSTDLNFKHHAK
jgi:hypothetical protein